MTSAIVVVVVAVVVVVREVVLRDRSRAVSVDAALDRFRSSTTIAATSTPPTATVTTTTVTTTTVTDSTVADTTQPPPATVAEVGIYRYRTTGTESIDALDGASHDYPAETTMTVTSDGCGVLIRWDALVERYDEWRLCATDSGIELQPNGRQYHEFFSQPDDEAVVCDRGVVLVPTLVTANLPPVSQQCMLAEDPWLPVWQVLERSTRDVDGVAVELQHVRMTITDVDQYSEHTQIDWYLDPHGLPVEVTGVKVSTTPSPIGPVTYHEQYHLELESTTPLQ
ncbi:MAG TPA: hypothetical protein VIK05_09345 [Ilumatobacteraceae bacterium]